jgi:hypothetical protein
MDATKKKMSFLFSPSKLDSFLRSIVDTSMQIGLRAIACEYLDLISVNRKRKLPWPETAHVRVWHCKQSLHVYIYLADRFVHLG